MDNDNPKPRRETCSLYLPPDLIAWIEEQANADKRSFSNWVQVALERLREDQKKIDELCKTSK